MGNMKVLSLGDIKSAVSLDEWQTRIDLAACYRLMAVFGMTDLIYNHISARVPGEDGSYLINPYGMLYEEITASNLVKIDVDGNTRSQRVELEARDESALLALIDTLNAVPRLKSVQLVRQQRNTGTDASGRGSVEATLQLRWQEAAP